MGRHTYRVDLAYDGSGFAGFKSQTGLRTVESVLVGALRPFIPELPSVACGGRTDRGVHASGQVVSFYSRTELDTRRIADAIDRSAPGEIRALRARCVPRSFHASFGAVRRRYRYRCNSDLEPEEIHGLLQPLIGERCFTAFARDTPAGASTICHLLDASASRVDGQLQIDLYANRFIRRQVRVMVASALHLGRQSADPDALLRLCETGNRAATQPAASPGGLDLIAVEYA